LEAKAAGVSTSSGATATRLPDWAALGGRGDQRLGGAGDGVRDPGVARGARRACNGGRVAAKEGALGV